MLCAVLCLGVLLGMAPCAAAEEAVHGEEKPFGVPVELTGVMLGGRQVYLGVGEKGNGGEFYLMKASDRSCIASECLYLHVCVGLFWKQGTGNGKDYIQFSKAEQTEILKQLSDVKLTLSPRDGQATAPTPEMRPDGMPGETVYRLYGKHAGKWLLTASCKVDGAEYKAYSLATRTVVSGPEPVECTTVEQINDYLTEAFKDISTYDNENSNFVIFTIQLTKDEYTGVIDVPKEPEGYRTTVVLEGQHGYNQRAKLTGGIHVGNDDMAISGIDFAGAGKAQNPRTDGTPNCAIYGDGSANFRNCSFADYYHAVEWTKGMRVPGGNCTYRNNYIAWYVDAPQSGGGNPGFEDCTFENNICAIYAKNFGGTPLSMITPAKCKFINNGIDVINLSGKIWFLANNRFIHGTNKQFVTQSTELDDSPVATFAAAAEEADAPTAFAYPMMAENEEGYDYETDDKVLTISADDAKNYAIPESVLAGKTLRLLQPESGAFVASFAFTGTAGTGTFCPAVTFEEGPRQLSVSVESMGALTAEVTVASGFERAVVLDSSGSKVKSATEKGLTTFQATNGGTYTILYVGVDAVKNGSSVNVSYRAEAAGVQVIALYDASGRMLDAETRSGAAGGAWMVTLTGASGTEVRVFQLDAERFGPLAAPLHTTVQETKLPLIEGELFAGRGAYGIDEI